MKKIEKGLTNGNKYQVMFCQSSVSRECYIIINSIHVNCVNLQDEEYRAKLKKSNERSLALIKSAMDIVVAAGLLQLSPEKITPRVTGAFGFITSIISCYQVTQHLSSSFSTTTTHLPSSSNLYMSLNKHSCFLHVPRSKNSEAYVRIWVQVVVISERFCNKHVLYLGFLMHTF